MGNQFKMTDTSGHHNDALRGVVAVGASAGGVEALSAFAARLPSDLPVCSPCRSAHARRAHRACWPRSSTAADRCRRCRPPTAPSWSPERSTWRFPTATCLWTIIDCPVGGSDGKRVPTGDQRPLPIRRAQPSVTSAIGVVLSGVLDDGVARSGGDPGQGRHHRRATPDDALFPAMPQNALGAGVIDHKAAATEIGPLLAQLAGREIEERVMEPDDHMELENRIAMARQVLHRVRRRSAGTALGVHLPGLQRVPDDVATTTSAAGWGTRGAARRCSRHATTRSSRRCGSLFAACRRRRSCAKMADNVGPGCCIVGTPKRPTRPNARCRYSGNGCRRAHFRSR